MTRLRTEWISTIENTLIDYDIELKTKTGCGLAELAARTCGMSEDTFIERVALHKVASIPITQGEGIIGSFAQSVAMTSKIIGADSFVTENSDVSGVHEAITNKADIIFMADDYRFISLNIKTGIVGENNKCTAMGYVKALELMSGGLKGKEVLVIGCGNVGIETVAVLKEIHANVTVYDIDDIKTQKMGTEIKRLKSKKGIKDFLYIVDATNTGNWLEKEMLNKNVSISALGVPMSLTDGAMAIYGERTVHDLLPLGTAVMLASVI